MSHETPQPQSIRERGRDRGHNAACRALAIVSTGLGRVKLEHRDSADSERNQPGHTSAFFIRHAGAGQARTPRPRTLDNRGRDAFVANL